MSYSLTQRQARAFRFVGSALNPRDGEIGPNKVLRGADYPTTFDFANFPCHLTSSKEVVNPGTLGLEVQDVLDTLDILRVPDTVRLQPGAYVLLNTPGHPSDGDWYTIQGAAQDYAWRARTAAYRLKKATKPPGWPA